MIYCGDNLDLLRSLADCSVDAIVTDPPYELGFMGRKWDRSGVAYDQERWRECLRVAKPGAHLLAFGGTRTYHRMATAIEDAGWEIRDCLQWLYGSGFPKSLDVGKALDKAAGAEREPGRPGPHAAKRGQGDGSPCFGDGIRSPATALITSPATPLAAQWDGWGTALKPACEPIVMARKPLDGTVAANVAKWGTGAINVDGGRIATGEADARAMERCNSPGAGRFKGNEWAGGSWPSQPPLDTRAGRWPANVLLDEAAAALLDEQSGECRSAYPGAPESAGRYAGTATPLGPIGFGIDRAGLFYADTGGASRFFYVAKASRAEREAGLVGVRNDHCTVKPIDLLRYLCRLVCPPGGLILDPYTGSGTTGIACVLEGFAFVGAEQDPDHHRLAEARIAAAMAGAFTVLDGEVKPSGQDPAQGRLL